MVLGHNITSINLLGFPNLQNLTFLFLPLLVLIYGATISGNLLIIVLYLVSRSLQSPMYFFITQLSLCDLLVSTDIVPTLLHTVLYGGSTMTLIGCFFQYSVFATSESSECLLLSVMSYDRCLAICDPLRYHSIMNRICCVTSVILSWLVGFTVFLVNVISVHGLPFCGRHMIDHFYCDIEPIMQLFCSEISIIHKSIMGFLVVVVPLTIIVTSYVYIVITILKIPTSTRRHKAFSTCSSHLIVVSIFYGTLIIVYMVPKKGQSLILSKVLSLLYTVLTPLLNPIIYSLRNKDFKEAFHKFKGIARPRS